MSRLLPALSLAFVLPLAACFDVDIAANFNADDTATVVMKMTATPEFYQMAAASEEPFCENGEEEMMADGSYVCTETLTESVDDIIAQMEMGDAMDPDSIASGIAVERRDGGVLYVAYDLSELTSDMMPAEEDMDGMQDMLAEAFAGHGFSLAISGAEIIETNGTLSEDGTSASFEIPLTALLNPEEAAAFPETFNALVKPGN